MTPERNSRLAVVLITPRNPLNIGAAARAMSNFGFFDLRLVDPYEVAREEAVSAVGAQELMRNARVFPDVAQAVADCSLVVGATGLGHRVFQHRLYRLERGARHLRRHLETARAALLFGSEKFGLSNEDCAHCHWLTHIPTRAGHDSMNLAQAVAICLYELTRAPVEARREPLAADRAQGAELDRLTKLLEAVLQASGHTDYSKTLGADVKTHQLVCRLGLSARDASIWSGMFRQILWALRAEKTHPANLDSPPDRE